MTVYIILRGERGEGGDISEVHSSLDNAKERLNIYAPESEGWEYKGELEASKGCDWVAIETHQVIA